MPYSIFEHKKTPEVLYRQEGFNGCFEGAPALAGAGRCRLPCSTALQPCQALQSATNSLAFSPFRAFQLCIAQFPKGELACWPCKCQLGLGSAHSLVHGAQQKNSALHSRASAASSAWSPATSPFPAPSSVFVSASRPYTMCPQSQPLRFACSSHM